MSTITPLAASQNNFGLAVWPDRQSAIDLLPIRPEIEAAVASSTGSNYQPATLAASARDEGQLRLPQRPNLLTLSFFGDACLP